MSITSFSVKNFRTFRELELTGLKRVNLIGGENNVGKTALLEALRQFLSPDEPELMMRLNRLRGIRELKKDTFLLEIFHLFDISSEIELSGEGSWGTNRRRLRIRHQTRETSLITLEDEQDDDPIQFVEESPYEIVFLYEHESRDFTSRIWVLEKTSRGGYVYPSTYPKRERIPDRLPSLYVPARQPSSQRMIAERFGKMQVEGNEHLVIEALSTFEPRLKGLTSIPIGRESVMHANVGLKRLIPIGLLGDGMQRVLSVAVAFAGVSGGAILIDEIENGIHHSKLIDLWRTIAFFAKQFDVQVFATTHSMECLRAAHIAFWESEEYDFCYYRLDRVKGDIVAQRLHRDILDTALEGNFEVR